MKYNQRIKTYLNGIKNELILKEQLFSYNFARFASDIKTSCPKSSEFRGALESLGYKFIQSYYDPNLFKTDAKVDTIYDIFKIYKRENFPSEDYSKNIPIDSYKYRILF